MDKNEDKKKNELEEVNLSKTQDSYEDYRKT